MAELFSVRPGLLRCGAAEGLLSPSASSAPFSVADAVIHKCYPSQ